MFSSEPSVSRVLFRCRPAFADGDIDEALGRGGDHSSRPPITRRLKQPTWEPRLRRLFRAYRRRASGPPWLSTWSCFGWGFPCGGCYQLPGALLPHLFTLTFRCLASKTATGGMFSVALSCESPRPAVSRHPALWSPDFPPAPPTNRLRRRPPLRLRREPRQGNRLGQAIQARLARSLV